MPYDEQIKIKNEMIEQTYKKYKITTKPASILKNPSPRGYRHKVILTAVNIKQKIKLGLYIENTKTVKPVLNHHMHDEGINELFKVIEKKLQKYKIQAYEKGNPRGILKHVLIRKSFKENKYLVCFVTQGQLFPNAKNIIKDILLEIPNVFTVTQNIHYKDTPVVLLDEEKILYGKGYIYDEIDGLRFRLSTKSFYQINPMQMNNLYGIVLEKAGLTGKETVLDCYSGIGTITLLMAKKALKVIGVENNPAAVLDAKYNQKINDINNVTFIKDDATEFMKHYQGKVDVLSMDPTRAGATVDFLKAVKQLKPKKIVYIACDIETQARDILLLLDTYDVISIDPVDMFSDTKHIESVVLLKIKNK